MKNLEVLEIYKFEVNEDMRRICNKTTMLKTSLCDYCDAYILVKVTMIITRAEQMQQHEI